MAQALQERAYKMKVPSSTALLELSPEWPDMVSQGEEKIGTAKFPLSG